jgi:hypothetical protein
MGVAMTECDLLELSLLVDYDKDTGFMAWKSRVNRSMDDARWNSRYAGKECGTIDDRGYRRILFRGRDKSAKRIRVHQLAWYIITGAKQDGEIDHINQNKLDNRALNLRCVSKSTNMRNSPMKSNNSSGITGVTWHKQRKKWCAQASLYGKHHHIGLFESINDAANAVSEFRGKNDFSDNHGLAITRAAAQIGKEMK